MMHCKTTPWCTALLATALCLVAAAVVAQDAPARNGSVRAPVETAATLAAPGSVIGGFEGELRESTSQGAWVPAHGAEFGWGWAVTTDQRLGGKSTASLSLVHPGADGSSGALRVEGEMKRGFVAPWAGAVWFPGQEPMQPGDLSAVTELVFETRGQPGGGSVMLMTGAPSSMPQYASFEITDAWREQRINLRQAFPGADLKQVRFMAFVGATWGKFAFELDRVRLQ